MKDFRSAILETSRILNQIFLFDALLNALLVFMGVYLGLLLFGLTPIYAAFPALVYLVVSGYLRTKTNKARIVEGKHYALREKLRTAVDNMNANNPLVEELESEVLSEMRNVGISQFLNARGLSYKILIVTIFAFGIIFSSTLNISFVDLGKFSAFGYGSGEKAKGAGDFESVELKSDDKIYGDDEVAQLGSKDLDIRIKPVDFKVSVKEEGDIETGKFNDIFTKDAFLKESEDAKENIPKEQQELVKNYFNQLAQS